MAMASSLGRALGGLGAGWIVRRTAGRSGFKRCRDFFQERQQLPLLLFGESGQHLGSYFAMRRLELLGVFESFLGGVNTLGSLVARVCLRSDEASFFELSDQFTGG